MTNALEPEHGTQNTPVDPRGSDILAVAKGGGIVFIGTIATRGLSYIYSLALIWGMGADSFGQFTLAMAIVMFIGLVATIGLPQGILRYGAIQAQKDGKAGAHQVTMSAMWVTIPVSLLLTAAVFWAAKSLSTLVFHKEELTPIIQLLAASIPFMSLQSILLAGTRALKVMKYSTIVWVVQPAAALLLAILFLYLGGGAEAASLAYVISYIIGAGLSLYFYLRLIPRVDRGSGRFSIGDMIKFSIPLSMTEWMHFTNERIEIFFLGMLPGSLDISIYKIAWSLAGLETMLRLSLEQMLAPFSSDLTHRRELKQLEGLYKATTKWGFSGALMIFLVYVLFSRDILAIFDPALMVGSGVLIALSFAQLFNEFTGPCNTILLMSGRSDLTLINTIIIFVLSFALDWVLIPRYGLVGAAIVGSGAVILLNTMRVLEVWWTLKMHPFKLNFIKPVLAGLAAAGIIAFAQRLGLTGNLWIDVVLILIFCAIYLALIYLLKLDADDQVVIAALKHKLLTLRKTRQVESVTSPVQPSQDIQ